MSDAMPDADQVACPHCSVNVVPGVFCSACGMALPSLTPSRPRIISGKTIATTAVGQTLQSAELLSSARQAARSLLSIGIINLAFGGMNLYYMMTVTGGNWSRAPVYTLASTATMLIAGSLYVGMYYWAKIMPLAAAVVGLIVYIGKWGADITIQNVLSTNPNAASMNNYQWIRILMVIYLFRGVMAGLKHRKLERQQSNLQPMPVIPVE